MVLRGFLFTSEDFALSWLICADLIYTHDVLPETRLGSSHCRP